MLMMPQLKQIVLVFTIKGQNLKRQYLNLKMSRLKIVEQMFNLVVMVPLIFQNIMEMLLQLILIIT